ncbi:YaiI/YqxD family protein [Limnobacter sp.]|uniref:YaiI/YqxD family protein n=1 Tax=Limnobacter sp. TaxID=2003368 RepID=UPI003516EFA6
MNTTEGSLDVHPRAPQIWVDADACPVAVKEMLYRAAERTKLEVTLVANQYMRTPPSKFIRLLQVPKGFDVADDEIVRRAQAGDWVISSDIPLASQLIAKGVHVLTPRGERLSKENIEALHTMRDFMDTLRASGIETGGPPAYSQADKKAFAAELDKAVLTMQRLIKKGDNAK